MESLFNNIQHIIQNQRGLAFLGRLCCRDYIRLPVPACLPPYRLSSATSAVIPKATRKRLRSTPLCLLSAFLSPSRCLALRHRQWGRFLSFAGQWLYVGLAAIAVVMGLQLMGLVSIPLPFQKTRQVKSRGLWGAFLLGLLTGTVSSPCATPVLAVILAYVSTQGDVLYGGSLLFVYAVGHCALIFIAGLSIGLTESMVNSKGIKNFSLYSKRFSGAVLVAAGLYLGIVNF